MPFAQAAEKPFALLTDELLAKLPEAQRAEPVKARAKEPPSLSGGESANLMKFLMRSGPATPEVVAMIEAALKWFDAHRLTGLRKTKNDKGKTDYIAEPASTEVLWARFHDLQTAKPIFAGADDGIVYSTFQEMAAKNKVAYDFFSTRPAELLGKELPRWRKRLEKGRESALVKDALSLPDRLAQFF